MIVDSECSVAISSLSEGECFPIITDPTINTEGPSSTDQISDNIVAVIGGVVAVVLIIAITITVIVMIVHVAVLMNHRRGMANTEK